MKLTKTLNNLPDRDETIDLEVLGWPNPDTEKPWIISYRKLTPFSIHTTKVLRNIGAGKYKDVFKKDEPEEDFNFKQALLIYVAGWKNLVDDDGSDEVFTEKTLIELFMREEMIGYRRYIERIITTLSDSVLSTTGVADELKKLGQLFVSGSPGDSQTKQ